MLTGRLHHHTLLPSYCAQSEIVTEYKISGVSLEIASEVLNLGPTRYK